MNIKSWMSKIKIQFCTSEPIKRLNRLWFSQSCHLNIIVYKVYNASMIRIWLHACERLILTLSVSKQGSKFKCTTIIRSFFEFWRGDDKIQNLTMDMRNCSITRARSLKTWFIVRKKTWGKPPWATHLQD